MHKIMFLTFSCLLFFHRLFIKIARFARITHLRSLEIDVINPMMMRSLEKKNDNNNMLVDGIVYARLTSTA